jgi:hypothetical protein
MRGDEFKILYSHLSPVEEAEIGLNLPDNFLFFVNAK